MCGGMGGAGAIMWPPYIVIQLEGITGIQPCNKTLQVSGLCVTAVHKTLKTDPRKIHHGTCIAQKEGYAAPAGAAPQLTP